LTTEVSEIKVLYPEATIVKAHTILGKERWHVRCELLLKKMTVLPKK
jgi:hypothetical protein